MAHEERDLKTFLDKMPKVELHIHLEGAIPLKSLYMTGIVKRIEEHPAGEYYKKGMKVFLNTDDPKMFNNTLVDEYSAFMSKGFDLTDVKNLMMNAIDSAWCSEDRKINLRNELNNYYINN